jgi:hypothetical protein
MPTAGRHREEPTQVKRVEDAHTVEHDGCPFTGATPDMGADTKSDGAEADGEARGIANAPKRSVNPAAVRVTAPADETAT